ncbi:hypothetical protein EG346_21375 [Chryseobacterium carnipullorum]|jgi:hypothetical protein|uniref:DUF4968 domain-containing protein n=9 Tax=Weeksellaceae TaxID=2762318 RepID=A0A3G6RP56_CHRLC|nr:MULTISPECIES: hypothetical protein [Weeksellaceae]QIY82486.1 hypothetical protein HER18_02475 [Chryseobacterium sp. NEB161]AZA50573.1 hypothetical protein EG346_21375 [Chryseobacterium carnipullorum]AZA83271.1 hypothetical protein EG342_15920 [Chryseobacterium lactis]AZB03656.1 hypothetical protein EG341_06790 [Chryseobacterium lactis]AZI40573.1 hypothetical protein EIB74_11675 [Epilithonimonas vandammei]
MRVVFFTTILLISSQINAQLLPKYTDSLKYKKDTAILGLSNKKEIVIDFKKPQKKSGFNFSLGKEKEVIYRDNFTNRIYFQNGFDRTLIYQRDNTTK